MTHESRDVFSCWEMLTPLEPRSVVISPSTPGTFLYPAVNHPRSTDWGQGARPLLAAIPAAVRARVGVRAGGRVGERAC